MGFLSNNCQIKMVLKIVVAPKKAHLVQSLLSVVMLLLGICSQVPEDIREDEHFIQTCCSNKSGLENFKTNYKFMTHSIQSKFFV